MKLIIRLLGRWPVFLAALTAAGIVHICTVLAMPYFYRNDAVVRLQRTLPQNSFVILPAAKPRAQVLAYQHADSRYAICSFDLRDGPVVVRALLAEPGWTLTAYGPGGESFYSLPAPENRRLSLSLLILPGGERFLGPMHDARSLDQDISQVTAPTRTGLVVIQAPLKGRTYVAEVEQGLAQANCRKLSF